MAQKCVIARYRPVAASMVSLFGLAICSGAIAASISNNALARALVAEPGWAIVRIAGAAAVLIFGWMSGSVFYRVIRGHCIAVWVEAGALRTALWSAPIDKIGRVEFDAAAPNGPVRVVLNSGAVRYVPTVLLRENGEEVAGHIRAWLKVD